MPYTPPVGTADLSLRGSYTPPVGTTNLSLGAGGADDRSLTLGGVTSKPTGLITGELAKIATLAGWTPIPTGLINALSGRLATLDGLTAAPTGLLLLSTPTFVGIAGLTPTPTGQLIVQEVRSVLINGLTLPPLGLINTDYDPNLLSDTTALIGEAWQPAIITHPGPASYWQTAVHQASGGPGRWQATDERSSVVDSSWQTADRPDSAMMDLWQAGETLNNATLPYWQQAERLDRASADLWQDADAARQSAMQGWRDLPLLPLTADAGWQDGRQETQHYREGFTDGAHRSAVIVEVWQPGGYPGNAPNPGPSIPPVTPTPWVTRLRLICRLPGTRLAIGRTPCILIADREVAIRRTYMSVNSASLVRWPDLTPLPCTGLTIETDFDSWCWGLSATLAGPDAWALVQPNPLACEVLATINGVEWKFLLDVPSTQRSFNSDRVSLKGRSRSAWLHEPYTRSSNRDEAEAREMVQVAETALENSGWTLDWPLENWLIPAGRYASWNTPIGALMRLVQVTDDGLYTEPSLQVLRAVRRWPVASWLLDGETADLAIPESAVISLSQAPVYSPPYNGVYVSGISHGAIALVKIAGTDGALQPGEPLTHELLCDEAGVGARQRGLNFLSDSGAGYELDAEVLFTPEVGLVRPGLIVSIAGVKGISRSCRISAQWGGDGLTVRQSVGLERREVESA